MALLPLKQTVTIRRPGEADEWGESTSLEYTFTLRCRVDESNKLVRRTSAGSGMSGVSSEEVVAVATITFDKLADIRHSDIIEFTNELGVTTSYEPLNITVIRGVNGKPMLTEVSV